MQVVETNIKFKNSLDKRKVTKRIVLHHSASGLSTTYLDIQQWHLNKGWSGIGYHYVIYPNGTIYRGRAENVKGAHAYQDANHEANSDGIGICFIGNFETGEPTEAQLISVVELVRDIRTRYFGIPVVGHKDVMATACPGEKFPWDELKIRLEGKQVAAQWKLDIIQNAKKAGLISDDHEPDEAATKWFVLAVALNMLKILRG